MQRKVETARAKRQRNRRNRTHGHGSNGAYLIAEDQPINGDEQEYLFQLSRDLFDAAEATVNYAQFSKDSLLIDLDKYMQR